MLFWLAYTGLCLWLFVDWLRSRKRLRRIERNLDAITKSMRESSD